MKIKRRVFFLGVGLAGLAATVPGWVDAALASDTGGAGSKLRARMRSVRARNRRVSAGATSANGWEMETVVDGNGHIYTRPVPGTPLRGVQVRIGEVEQVLVHAIQRFHYEVDGLRDGDVESWRPPANFGGADAISNLASGTAVRVRPGFYPAGSEGGFFPGQLAVLRDILAELDGVVRWGGDDAAVDESLLYIDVRPGDPRLSQVAERIRGWSSQPGIGAGGMLDIYSPARRKRARRIARAQRREGH